MEGESWQLEDKCHPYLQGGGPGDLQAGQSNLSTWEDYGGSPYRS